MATPPDSPIEEVVYDLEPSRLPKHRPVPLEDLCRQTKFTRQEIRVMYRGFKQRRVRIAHSKKHKKQSLFKRAEKLKGKVKFVESRKEISIPGRIIFEPPKRKTGQDTTKAAPPFWPTKVQKALDELYRPNDAILGELEDEEDDIKIYEPDPEPNPPWNLSDLSMEALQGFLQRESLVFLNAQYIPFELTDRMHQVLPTDVNYKNAILVIGEGVYWKRCLLAKWPTEYPYPLKEGFSYKVLFVQHWFAEYLGELEPGYIDYSDVVGTTRIANPWVFRLNIKQLNAPKHKIMEPYNPFGYDEALSDVDADTCLKVRPYPKRLNLLKVLPHLKKLEVLQICFGFVNYERHPGFSHARMRSIDLDLFSEALTRCSKLKSVRIYMSAFYSVDLKRMIPYLNKMRHLKRLEFSNCRLDDMGANIIARFLVENKTVRMISLKRNCITPKGIFDLSRTLAMPRKSRSPLTVLDLSFNIVSNLGAIYLACALLVNHKLVCLKLVGCDIGDVGGMALCYSVGINRCLGKLDLTANKLTNATAKVVIASLENNPNIEEIDVRGNDISEISLRDIMDLSKEKRMMRRKKMNVRRREVILGKTRGAMVRLLRRDDVEKERWAAHEDAGHSSTCSQTDSGSITSLGSYSSGDIDEEDVIEKEAASPPKAFHEL